MSFLENHMWQVISADVFVQELADELLAQDACAVEQASRHLMTAFLCLQWIFMLLTVI